MSRKDSGFEQEQESAHRRSTSTTSSHRRKHQSSTVRSMSASTSRTTSRRTSRSIHGGGSYTHTRPALQTHHTLAVPYFQQQQAAHEDHEFVQFPSIASHSDEVEDSPAPPPPPPATINYWTSEETRRLEYAAIDAASRGVRGFVTKILPDCVLPCEYRRPSRFHCKDDDEDSDAGSVRRYRLTLPEEKTHRCTFQQDVKNGDRARKVGFMSKIRRAITS